MAADELKKWISDNDVTIEAVFVPWSQSRNRDEKDSRGRPRLSLNWKVTLKKAGREILTTDYMAGEAHCPSYNFKLRGRTFNEQEAIESECETGRPAKFGKSGKILPNSCDVLSSLASDSDVLDSGSFEEWARDLGYDEDSRSAEKTYRACLEIALKLRNGLGEAGLASLREAAQDY